MSSIYLIRHGRTMANEKRLYCGRTDLPLSEGGRKELGELRDRYPRADGFRFITSGMRRTDETLGALFGTVPFSAEPRMRETDFGAFEMRGYEELKNDADYQRWLAGDNMANIPPGGESGEQMRARVLSCFGEICCAGQDTVIVTHGGVIAVIMEFLFSAERRNFYEWQPAPGRGYALTDGTFRALP